MIHFRYKPFKHQKNNSRVRSGRKVLPALVLTAAFLLPAGISSADRSSDPGYVVYADENDEIQEIRDKNKEREKKIAEAQARLQSLNTAVADIREVIAELDQQIGDYRIQIINLTNERNAVQAEIAVTESNLQLAYIAEANQYENMKERIAYAYENGDVKYIDALIALDDFSDVINQSEYVEQVSSYDQQQLNKLISIKQEIRAQETLLADKLAQILEIKADTEAEQAALEITVEGKKDLLNEYGEQIYATNGEITTYQQLIEEGNYEIQRLDAEYRRKQEEAKRKKKAAEEARKKAAEEAKNAKNEAAKKAAEEAQKAAEEEARKAEEAEKKAAEELARKTSEEEALREAEEAARKEQENTEEPETEEPTTVPPSSDDSDTDDSGSDDSDSDDSDSDDSDSDDSDSDDSDQDSDFSEVTPSNIWLWPCPSSHSIASYFGYRTPPCKGATSYHEAIDIGCHIGTNVVAASSGRVMYTSYSFARGNYIKLDHGNGITTLYQHLSSFAGYSSGDYVEAGTVIAYSGDTGICSAPHLHFEVAVNDTPVNPLNYVSP